MDYKQFEDILAKVAGTTALLEETYIENEGEVTVETEQMEETIAELKELLTTDGVDFLGRWLKSKEDAKATLKAEKDYITRKIQSVDKSIEFIKDLTRTAMDVLGIDKVKGQNGYSFTASQSTKTEVNKDVLNDMFREPVEKALREGGIIPADVTVTLGASVSALEDGAELPEYYNRTTTPAVRFGKPRASK